MLDSWHLPKTTTTIDYLVAEVPQTHSSIFCRVCSNKLSRWSAASRIEHVDSYRLAYITHYTLLVGFTCDRIGQAMKPLYLHGCLKNESTALPLPKDDPKHSLTPFVPMVQEEYVRKEWNSPEELHWIGKYAADAYKIFIERKWSDVQPNDHALNWWVEWMRGTEVDRQPAEGSIPPLRVYPPGVEADGTAANLAAVGDALT